MARPARPCEWGEAGVSSPPMAIALHIVDAGARADVLDQLARLAGHADRVVSVGPAPRVPLPLPVRPVHRPLGSARLAAWRMRPLAEGVDVLHAWSPVAAAAGRELTLACGKALVVSLPSAGPPREAERLRQRVGPGLLGLAVPTRAARAALIRAGLPEAFVHVLPPAADGIADRQATRAAVRASLGVAAGDCLVAAPDPMVRHAGHDIAAWAHAIAREAHGPVRLLLPGDGPHAAAVRFFAGTTGHDDEIHLTGGLLSRDEALAAADVAVFFHVRSVGVATLASAMAAGLPIAASATAEIAECVADGVSALLVPPNDPLAASAAMLRLVEEGDFARRLGQAARRAAKRLFDLAACRRRLDAIYAALIAARAYEDAPP